jgi:DNA polymerase-3 subunit epsilon
MKSPLVNFVVLDTETVGLSPQKNCLIEIFCCSFDNEMNDLKEFHTGVMQLYDKNREVSPQALQANGITTDQIENGNDPKYQLDKLIEYLQKLKSGRNKPVICGHNLNFDIGMLSDYFSFYGKKLDDYFNEDFTIDTMWWARLKAAEQANYKLGTCCEEEGIELINAHRAQADTIANKQLVKKYIQNLRSDSEMEKGKRFRATFEF